MKKEKIHFLMLMLLSFSLACSLVSTPATTRDEAPAAPVEMPVDEPPAVEAEAAPPASETDSIIPAAGAPVTANCDLFDIAQFNAIAGKDFALVSQDQLGSCHYEADGVYRIMIGGGQISDSASAQAAFESTMGSVPGATWKSYADGFQLGMASSSVSVTGQGVSASGHAMAIVAAGMPSGDLSALDEILTRLAEEAARQLNGQW